MPTHVTESTGASITANWEFTTGSLQVSSVGSFLTNTVTERVSGEGVTIEGVKLSHGASGTNYFKMTADNGSDVYVYAHYDADFEGFVLTLHTAAPA